MKTGQGDAPSETYADRLFGGYRVMHEIASGGMAGVWLGQKSGPGGFSQLAALKVIHPHLARNPAFVEMFLDEARIASHISHPNVVRVLDFGEANGTYYLAMEFIMGETWSVTRKTLRRQHEARHQIPGILAYVLTRACEGLHAAHEALDYDGLPLDIVHRDVAPQNIMVGYDGSVRVLDFGVARAADRIHATRDGSVKGRYSYMAPEQMVGSPVDRRADVWSLGVILREGLTSQGLFRRETDAETILAVTQLPFPEWPEGIPPQLRAVADRALSRDPSARYPTAREMGMDLTRYLNAQPEPLHVSGLSERMKVLFHRQIEAKRQLVQRTHSSPRLASAAAAMHVAKRSKVPPPPPSMAGVTPASLPPPPKLPEWPASIPPGDTQSSGTKSRVRVPTMNATPEAAWPAERSTRSPALKIAVGMALGILLGAWATSRSSLFSPPDERATATPEATVAPQQSTEVVAAGRPISHELAAEPSADAATLPPDPNSTKEASGGATTEDQAKAEKATKTRPHTRRRPPTSAAPARSTPASVPRNRATEPPAPGTVDIVTTNGWAVVYRAGQRLGTTPGRFELPAGPQRLGLVPLGAGPMQHERVVVRSGTTTKLRVELKLP